MAWCFCYIVRVLDLFSGIGGFSLGLERAGMRTVAFCENNAKRRTWLQGLWPAVPVHSDVRTLRGADVGPVELICGGFPCQPFSGAGDRLGAEDDRYLWPEYRRLVEELRPAWVLGENVVGIVDMALDDVLADLEGLGYATRAFDIPASALGAPHERRRIWIVANATGERRAEVALHDLARYGAIEDQGWASINAGPLVGACSWENWEEQSGVRLIVDGVPEGLALCQAAGNAIVPYFAEIFGRAIMTAESCRGDSSHS
jgi:DNA (cytosine-5)-methyltransferase 1